MYVTPRLRVCSVISRNANSTLAQALMVTFGRARWARRSHLLPHDAIRGLARRAKDRVRDLAVGASGSTHTPRDSEPRSRLNPGSSRVVM